MKILILFVSGAYILSKVDFGRGEKIAMELGNNWNVKIYWFKKYLLYNF